MKCAGLTLQFVVAAVIGSDTRAQRNGEQVMLALIIASVLGTPINEFQGDWCVFEIETRDAESKTGGVQHSLDRVARTGTSRARWSYRPSATTQPRNCSRPTPTHSP